MTSPSSHITLLELQTMIKRGLESALPLSYWVVAEVSELKVNYSGHCYMQLVEKGGRRELAQAQASAVAWRSSWGAIASHFRSATGSDIAPGMKLLLRVSVSYHEVYGLSLVVGDIDPAYTLGDVEAARRQTVEQLRKDGVFEMNRELGLPPLVQRIAVLSSRNAAGCQDFMRELTAGPWRFETELFDAFMQGDAAADSIIAALDAIAERADGFDAVALIRGGGSQGDLECFNNYRLCSHIAQFPLPVITGIGHDKDHSVADMVAAVELKTPTAVAAWLVDRVEGEWDYLGAMDSRLRQQAAAMLDVARRLAVRHAVELSRTATAMTRTLDRRIGDLQAVLHYRSAAMLERRTERLAGLRTLMAERPARWLQVQRNRLELMSGRADAHDPARILALGFAVVRAEGRVLRDSRRTSPGQPLEITLAHGRIAARVEDVE